MSVRITRVRYNKEVDPWDNGFDAGWRDAIRGYFIPSADVVARLTALQQREYRAAYLEGHAMAVWKPKNDEEVEKHAKAAESIL